LLRRGFKGRLDDFRIYSRALSDAQVLDLYKYESGPKITLLKAVKPSFSHLTLGTNYQLQVSGDMSNWTNHGAPFPATNMNMIYPDYFDVDDWAKRFFRLEAVP
jgi:hypothetical protein